MPKYKIKCPICEHEFTEKHIILIEKNKKEVEEKTNVEKLAPSVKKLIKQLSKKTIHTKDIKKITIVTADKEKLLQQSNNPGWSLEVTVVPGLEPK